MHYSGALPIIAMDHASDNLYPGFIVVEADLRLNYLCAKNNSPQVPNLDLLIFDYTSFLGKYIIIFMASMEDANGVILRCYNNHTRKALFCQDTMTTPQIVCIQHFNMALQHRLCTCGIFPDRRLQVKSLNKKTKN